jgi:hypothetical protein
MTSDQPYDAAQVDKIARAALFGYWAEAIQRGWLSGPGLVSLRQRIDAHSGEFFPGPDLDTLRYTVRDALAESLGVPPEDLPEPEVVPDDLSGL